MTKRKMLSRDEQVELARAFRKYHDSGNTAKRDEVFERILKAYHPAIFNLMKKFNVTPSDHYYEDILQNIKMSIFTGLMTYNPDRGTKLWTYLVKAIKGILMDATMIHRHTRNGKGSKSKWFTLIKKEIENNGRPLTYEEFIRKYPNMTVSPYYYSVRLNQVLSKGTFSEMLTHDGFVDVIDTIPSEDDTHELVEKSLDSRKMIEILDEEIMKEHHTTQRCYHIMKEMIRNEGEIRRSEISKMMGVSHQMVSNYLSNIRRRIYLARNRPVVQ